ncbi:HalOD1 output domain-containing protein [Halomicrobium salinisoli]|uniref:HalOD1 output domain-containing protein n=1 Tax=Halomicrobium salinisoli TaxID=2878391 RepID=UPI001CEFE449|nr:HalOD1 output domain-containing protein [Halomicrobium salinisoli]
MDNKLDWDPELQAYRVDLDAVEYVSTSVAVVRSVAALDDTPPTALDPLQESVDPDALDEFLSGENASERRVGFRYQGYEITVVGTGEIRLSPESDRDTISVS